jgi:hypothetical protein
MTGGPGDDTDRFMLFTHACANTSVHKTPVCGGLIPAMSNSFGHHRRQPKFKVVTVKISAGLFLKLAG